ncbi:putative Activating signal cointegrator 1 complex subunit 1 [Hypsibius exemplaris]|uniref:Activating signal cointegrator 1 complex subunit 1 n=1 Tax=Hypsibius exemplaris TaxID=2072580 RepID=A0A1W0XB63_HYPEX|nr:putative Activating signal cointegrator 1 complex subunit 1 [Hypsibius exemplaris]
MSNQHHFFNFSDKEVMTPHIKEMNGMFFRIHPVVDENSPGEKQSKEESISRGGDTANSTAVPFSDLIAEFSEEEQDVLYHRVRKTPGSDTFRLWLDQERIPSALFAMMIGKGGAGKKAIEDETKARIIFPDNRSQEQTKPIEIFSYDEVQLIVCRRRLLQSAQNARFKIPFTHFLCFPASSQSVHQSFQTFRNEVTKKCGGSRGFSPDLFQNYSKLHLTIGTLALFSQYEYGLAADGLTECFADGLWRELNEGPLHCRLKGLEIMNDDPSEVDVLYAKIEDPTGRLQQIADSVYEWFMEAEPRFLQDKFDHVDNVKLHVTLLNSRFRKGEEIGEEEVESVGGKSRSRKTFDATDILKHFGDYDFGTVHIKEIHVSQRFSSDSNGFYKATRKLVLDAEFFRSSETSSEQQQPFVHESYSDEPTCALDENLSEQ